MASHVPDGTAFLEHSLIPDCLQHTRARVVQPFCERVGVAKGVAVGQSDKFDGVMNSGLLNFIVASWDKVRQEEEGTRGIAEAGRRTGIQSVAKCYHRPPQPPTP